MSMIADLVNRPEDYRASIERYAPAMPPENAAAIRQLFPSMLKWSEHGFGDDDPDRPRFEPMPRVHKVFRLVGQGSMIDPLFWCYLDHDPARMDELEICCEPAMEWRKTHKDYWPGANS